MAADVPIVEQPVEPPATMRAVVCDDDAVVRSVVSELIEQRRGEIIAETDSGPDAVALAERFEPDVLVLDLGLDVGSGLEVLRHFERCDEAPAIVVFTSFDGVIDSPAATQVVRKPGFEQLERALDAVLQLHVQHDDRRRPTRAVPPPADRDGVGLDQTGAFYEILVDAEPDDVLVALHTDGLDPVQTAASVRRALRSEDRLTQRRDWLVALLVGGGEAGAKAVTERLSGEVPDVSARVRVASAGDAPAEVFVDLTT